MTDLKETILLQLRNDLRGYQPGQDVKPTRVLDKYDTWVIVHAPGNVYEYKIRIAVEGLGYNPNPLIATGMVMGGNETILCIVRDILQYEADIDKILLGTIEQ